MARPQLPLIVSLATIIAASGCTGRIEDAFTGGDGGGAIPVDTGAGAGPDASLEDAGHRDDAAGERDAGDLADAGVDGGSGGDDATVPAGDAEPTDAEAVDAEETPDAAPGDAAQDDAGAPDATALEDAAAPDAIAPDATAPDAAAPDAAAPDANAPDATAPDAAAPDATPGDAGLAPDGGSVDSGVYRPFSANSPWNTPIGANPAIDPGSTAMVTHLANSAPQWPWLDIAIAQFSVPVYYVDSTATPLVPVTVTRVAGAGFHTNPNVPIPLGAAVANGTDRHLAIVDRTLGTSWDFWHGANGAGGWTCDVCATSDLNGDGVRPYPQQGSPTWWLSHGARACGFPLTAGLISVDEIQAGRIEHALVIGYPGIRSRYFQYPASTAQATFGSLSQTTGIPCGARIQLDPSLDVDTLGLSASGRVIARALQEYGAYVGDYNGSISLYADASPTAMTYWSTGNVLRTAEVRNQIDLTWFRVLQLGQLYDDHN